MKYYNNNWSFVIFILALVVSSSLYAQKDAQQLIKDAQKAVGSWEKLYRLKDVEYTYDYYSPAKNVRDLSTERYIFEGEQSWGEYTTHQINILPNQPGKLVHSVVNGKPAIMLDGKSLEDEAALGAAQFLRTVNYFWFMMPFKLSDPSTKST